MSDALSNPTANEYTPIKEIQPTHHTAAGGSLPFTGFDLIGFVAVASILIVVGVVLRQTQKNVRL